MSISRTELERRDYKLLAEHLTETRAKDIAKRQRAMGFKARVINNAPFGWTVWAKAP